MRRLICAIVLGVQWTTAPRLEACASAPRPGESVAVAQEETLIIWDPSTQREHFVRRADFEAAGSDFGFLVPTPSRPELAEADDDVFPRLREATLPEVRWERRWRVQPTALVLLPFMFFRLGSAPRDTAGTLHVLEERRVAGLDAAVLQADDTQALGDWLKAHGYAWRPALALWIEPYVQRHWTISAFKIARASGGPSARVGTKALRMTFTTESPFFPYREPTDTPARGAAGFRAFVVVPGRVAATLGTDAAHASASWSGETRYARPIADAATLLAGTLPGAPGPGLWLTSFEDTSSKRADADLWFGPSPAQAEVVPPAFIRYLDMPVPLPLDVLAGLAILVRWFLVRRRSRRVSTAI